MITNLTVVSNCENKIEQTPAIVIITKPLRKKVRVKANQFTKWINPKNWFSRFASIDITMEEFACKKTTPKN